MSNVTNEALLKLAERCEAGETARELNRLIFATVYPGEFEDAKEAAQYADSAYRGNNADWYYLSTLGMPDYARSLDAAMSLVPEGYDWRIGRTNGGLTIHAEVGGQGDEYMRFAETPALALCAAALRARAALLARGGGQ